MALVRMQMDDKPFLLQLAPGEVHQWRFNLLAYCVKHGKWDLLLRLGKIFEPDHIAWDLVMIHRMNGYNSTHALNIFLQHYTVDLNQSVAMGLFKTKQYHMFSEDDYVCGLYWTPYMRQVMHYPNFTLLQMAICNEQKTLSDILPMIKLLLDHGADPVSGYQMFQYIDNEWPSLWSHHQDYLKEYIKLVNQRRWDLVLAKRHFLNQRMAANWMEKLFGLPEHLFRQIILWV